MLYQLGEAVMHMYYICISMLGRAQWLTHLLTHFSETQIPNYMNTKNCFHDVYKKNSN